MFLSLFRVRERFVTTDPLPGPGLPWDGELVGDDGDSAKCWEDMAALAARLATFRLERPAGNEADAAFLLAAPRGTLGTVGPDPPRAAPSARWSPDPWWSSSRCRRSWKGAALRLLDPRSMLNWYRDRRLKDQKTHEILNFRKEVFFLLPLKGSEICFFSFIYVTTCHTGLLQIFWKQRDIV